MTRLLLNLPVFERLTIVEPPKLLYHYTSPGGLHGILRSRRMWASSLQYLNDAQELRHAQALLRRGLQEFVETTEVLEDVRWVCRWLSEKLDHVESLDACAFSLSQWGDLLSQWRAYCAPPGGYSIGFRYDGLQRIADRHGIILNRCLYHEQLQKPVIQEVIRNVEQAVMNARTETSKRGEDFAALFLPGLLFEFSKVAPFIKHGAFAEEAEWRLVFPSPNIDQVPLDIRVSASRLVPHATIELSSEGLPLPVEEVIVGPCSEPEQSERALAILLKVVGLYEVTHRRSWAPYRAV